MPDDFEVIFVTASWCPHCRRLKEAWKPLFEQGIVKYIDVDTEEGMKLAKELNIDYVPVCLVKKDGEYRKCEGDVLER